jgi:hypothetical protein
LVPGISNSLDDIVHPSFSSHHLSRLSLIDYSLFASKGIQHRTHCETSIGPP